MRVRVKQQYWVVQEAEETLEVFYGQQPEETPKQLGHRPSAAYASKRPARSKATAAGCLSRYGEASDLMVLLVHGHE